MGLKHLALLALGGSQVVWASSEVKRQTGQTKYCPGNTAICFSEYKLPTYDIIYRIAIPDVSAAPFDVLLQIVSPISNGWAAIGWGGKMTNNPLTVAWPNGKSAVVSSRFATSRSLPGVYTGATYAVLPSSNTNATHWQLDVLCRGCSQWSGGSLNPSGVNSFSWAKSSAAVNAASSNTSSFQIHDGRGVFSHDLSAARIPKGVFDAVIFDLENPSSPPASSSSAPASSSSSAAGTAVTTRVTQLPPRPSSSTSSSTKPPVVVITVTNVLPTSVVPTRSTTYVIVTPKPTTKSTQKVVTVTVTATATPTQTRGGGPPWSGGGGPPWGGGGSGPPWGKGKGKGWGRRGKGRRLAAEPEE